MENVLNQKESLEQDIKEYDLLDQVLQANRSASELRELKNPAKNGDLEYNIRNGLLFYQGRLEIPETPENLRTKIIEHIHAEPMTTHPRI
ncbi:hypothetical protein GcM1_241078, partial [Golovinomyces cichoracearum]